MLTNTGAVLVSVKAKFPLSEKDSAKYSKRFVRDAKAVYIAIADRCNTELTAYPSQRCIADDTNCSERNVRRLINWLVDRNYLAIIAKGYPGRNTTYQWLNPEGLTLSTGFAPVPMADTSNVARVIPEKSRERSIEDDLNDRSWAT